MDHRTWEEGIISDVSLYPQYPAQPLAFNKWPQIDIVEQIFLFFSASGVRGKKYAIVFIISHILSAHHLYVI